MATLSDVVTRLMAVERLEHEVAERLKKIKEHRTALDNIILGSFARPNASDRFTMQGRTYSRRLRVTAGVENAPKLFDFVKTTGRFEFLSAKVEKDAALEYVEQHKVAPPGVKISSIYTLSKVSSGKKEEPLIPGNTVVTDEEAQAA